MGKFLTQETRLELIQRHKAEKNKYVCDRLKAVLAYDEGHSMEQIASILLLQDTETVRRHIREYEGLGKLKPANGGSRSKLTDEQTRLCEEHIETHVYTRVQELIAHVQATYEVSYTVSGMTKWLKQHRFVYKKPKAVPAKADLTTQAHFIEEYTALKAATPPEEPIIFMDAAHPTMATKITYGWIRKGVDKPIAQTASRTRVNVMGAIELHSMKKVTHCPASVNAETTVEFLSQVKAAYPDAPKLHVILDQSGYHRSHRVRAFASQSSIQLHYLPPYSPNLNPIERLWKVMNEQTRNNRVFQSAADFRETLADFFNEKLPTLLPSLRHRINDNFQTLKTAS